MAGEEWFAKLRGHVRQARERFAFDRERREQAGREPPARNIILTEREVRGDFDASRVLLTTLGGKPRPITADDLAQFRQNMRVLQRAIGTKNRGITPRQVIDLAAGRPLGYAYAENGINSDIDKARREITHALPVSAVNGTVRFITNSGPNSKVQRHNVVVQFLAWDQAVSKLAACPLSDKAAPMRIARWLRQQRVAFDCDCERHTFFFRYIATIGGFAAGRQETGYPKIRNPKLMGVACKHVLRVMTEIASSGLVLNFLAKHLAATRDRQARTQMLQQEANKLMKQHKAPTRIKTSEQLKSEARKRREARAAAKEIVKPTKPPRKRTTATRRSDAKKDLQALIKKYGLTPEQIRDMLGALNAK